MLLSGVGQGQSTVSPASLFFGIQKVGAIGARRSVSIANNMNASMPVGTIKVSGDFVADSKCPAALAPQRRCTIWVRFHPTAVGRRSGTLTIVDDTKDGLHLVHLSGAGVR
jgi:hypothetical protein